MGVKLVVVGVASNSPSYSLSSLLVVDTRDKGDTTSQSWTNKVSISISLFASNIAIYCAEFVSLFVQ